MEMKNPPKHVYTYYYTNTGSIITEKTHTRDLGVTISNDCSFNEHISETIETGKKLSGWILRTFKSRDVVPMLTLWKSLVLPKLEYCSQLWCPLQTGVIQKIELLQKSFLNKIKGSQNLTYWEQLIKFHLYSLQRRRERYRIIYVRKILETICPNVSLTDDSKITITSSTRRGRKCYLTSINKKVPIYLQNIRQSSLSIHGSKLFNALPKYLRDTTGCSVDKFKKRLDWYLKHVPDEPLIPGYTAYRRADSNSLLDMITTISAKHATSVFQGIGGLQTEDENLTIWD